MKLKKIKEVLLNDIREIKGGKIIEDLNHSIKVQTKKYRIRQQKGERII